MGIRKEGGEKWSIDGWMDGWMYVYGWMYNVRKKERLNGRIMEHGLVEGWMDARKEGRMNGSRIEHGWVEG